MQYKVLAGIPCVSCSTCYNLLHRCKDRPEEKEHIKQRELKAPFLIYKNINTTIRIQKIAVEVLVTVTAVFSFSVFFSASFNCCS